jgi:hypothetical protein
LLIPVNVSAVPHQNTCEKYDDLINEKEKLVKALREGGYVTWAGQKNKLDKLIEEKKQCTPSMAALDFLTETTWVTEKEETKIYGICGEGTIEKKGQCIVDPNYNSVSEQTCGPGDILQDDGVCIVTSPQPVYAKEKSSWFSWVFDLFQGFGFDFGEPTTVSKKSNVIPTSDNAIYMTHQEQLDFLKEGEVLAPYVNPSNPYP